MRRSNPGSNRARRQRGVRHHAVVNRAPPECLELAAGGAARLRRGFGGQEALHYRTRRTPRTQLSLPVLANDLIRRSLRSIAERREHFVCGPPAIERRDQRLNDRNSAVEGPSVAPRFKKMRLGNLPVGNRGSFVRVQAQVRAHADLVHLLGESQVGRCGVNRIAADDRAAYRPARRPSPRQARGSTALDRLDAVSIGSV